MAFYFKEEAWDRNMSALGEGWKRSASAAYIGRRGQAHIFTLQLRVRASSPFSIAIDTNGALNYRYSAFPFKDGVIQPATDGVLLLGNGAGFDPGFATPYGPRYFNGLVTYCVLEPGQQACDCARPAGVGLSQLPPTGQQPRPAPAPAPGQSASAASAAELAAALRNPAVTLVRLTSNILISQEFVVLPGTSVTIRGDTAACASAMPPSFYYYDCARCPIRHVP